jgi:hypothetical protein
MTLTSSNSEFVRECAKRKYWVSKKNKQTQVYTHLSMDGHRGGIIRIPPASEWEMLQRYAKDLETGKWLYLSEVKTPIFRFFVDFDVDTGSRQITPAGRLVILKLIFMVVRLFYPKNTPIANFTMLILDNSEYLKKAEMQTSTEELEKVEICDIFEEQTATPPATKYICETHKDKSMVSNNLHIIFPKLLVNQEQAYLMAQLIICKAKTEIGDIGLGKTWDDVIDNSVYLSNGLRMPGSRKCAKCPECHGKKCSVCCELGKVDLGRVYGLVQVFQKDEYNTKILNKLKINNCQMLAWCTIRRPKATKQSIGDWKSVQGCPPLSSAVVERITTKQKKILTNSTMSDTARFEKLTNLEITSMSPEDRAGIRQKQKSLGVEFQSESLHYQAALFEIRRVHMDYNRILIRKLQLAKNKRYYVVTVLGEGSSRCMNLVKKEHKNNSIYFIIKPSGVYQKCFCKCSTTDGRKFTMCKNYISGKNQMVSKSQAVLFPHLDAQNMSHFASPFAIDSRSNCLAEVRTLSRLYMNAYGDSLQSKQDTKTPRKKRKQS